MPAVFERMARAGITLSSPPPRRLRKAKAVSRFDRWRGRQEVNVFCDDWDVVLDEESGRVVHFYNARLERVYPPYDYRPRSEGPDPLAIEYERPKMTAEEAKRIIDERDFLTAFQVDRERLELGEPRVTFHKGHDLRGWHIVYFRSHRGYPFFGEAVSFIIHDQARELSRYSYEISEAVPPDPAVKVAGDQLRGITEDYLQGPSPHAERFRERGFSYRPETLEVEPPQYVRADFAFRDGRRPSRSPSHPLRLAYICRFKLNHPSGSYYNMEMWIDAETGKIVGGDFGYQPVVPKP